MLLSDAKKYIINGKEAKELWLGGNKIWELTTEEAYTTLDYIQTSSSSGGFDLGFVPTVYTGVEVTIQSSTYTSGYNMLWDSGQSFSALVNYRASWGTYYYDVGFSAGLNGYLCKTTGESTTNPFKNKSTYAIKNRTLYRNGTSTNLTDTTSSITQPTKTLKILDTNNSSVGNPLIAKIYGCKIYDENDNVIMNWIPVLRGSDSQPYLYDTINKVFVTSTSPSKLTYA